VNVAMTPAASRRVLIPIDLPPAARLPERGAQVRQLGGPTMGTSWSVKLVDSSDTPLAPVQAAIERILADVIAQMSTWAPDSNISRFNRAAGGTWVELPGGLHDVLQYALKVAAETGGCYDPTIGALVNLWGFGPHGRRNDTPDDPSIAEASACGGFRRVRLGPGRRGFQPGGAQLDLSSVAKGFAVDRVSESLVRLGIGNHLVEIGGELRGRGTKPDGSPWWVALEQPRAERETPADETIVALCGLSVATSGDAQRCFEWNGRRWSHTIDPRTGRPVPERLAAVTVLHRSCMCADALATALTVLGPDGGLDYAEACGVAARFIVRRARGIDERITSAFAAMSA